MNRRASLLCLPWRAGFLSAALPFLVLVGLVGCLSQNARLQSEDETEQARYDVRTVGDVTTVGYAEPTPVGGVGLVVDLDGTGGEARNDSFRQLLEDDLKKKGVKNIKKLLTDPSVAMVLVSAAIPPGANKRDTFDVEVAIPPGSRATSLRGGYLKECVLFNYDMTKNLSPTFNGPQSMLKGHPIGRAEGPVLVGFGEADEAGRQKQGRIWGGGRTVIDTPLSLLLNPDFQFARVSAQIADRVNETFHGAARGVPGNNVAIARNHLIVSLHVPAQYRLNLPRFLRVVRLVPFQGTSAVPGAAENRPYGQRLAEDLLDPARTVTAALRLEALGSPSIPVLKTGLESKEWLVRFCAAEALAYLGSPACGEELARFVEQQPVVRAFSLTALASLDEAVAQVKLQDLLLNSNEDEVRYGAFCALRALDERNPYVQGELLNNSFWLHRLAPDRPGLVHVSGHRRAEVVIFGPDPVLLPPFSFSAGDFVLTASREDDSCTVSRIPAHGGEPIRKQCPLKLMAVLRTMAEMDCMYPEVIDLLGQAHACQVLTCKVRVDALPQTTSVYELARLGRGQASGDGKGEAALAGTEQGTPNALFEPAHVTRQQSRRDEDTLLRPRDGKEENKSPQGLLGPGE